MCCHFLPIRAQKLLLDAWHGWGDRNDGMDWTNVSTELFDRYGRCLGGGRGMEAPFWFCLGQQRPCLPQSGYGMGMAQACLPSKMMREREDATQEWPAVLFCSIWAPIVFQCFPFEPRWQVFDQRVQQLTNFMEEHDHLPQRKTPHQATLWPCCVGAVCHWRRKKIETFETGKPSQRRLKHVKILGCPSWVLISCDDLVGWSSSAQLHPILGALQDERMLASVVLSSCWDVGVSQCQSSLDIVRCHWMSWIPVGSFCGASQSRRPVGLAWPTCGHVADLFMTCFWSQVCVTSHEWRTSSSLSLSRQRPYWLVWRFWSLLRLHPVLQKEVQSQCGTASSAEDQGATTFLGYNTISQTPALQENHREPLRSNPGWEMPQMDCQSQADIISKRYCISCSFKRAIFIHFQYLLVALSYDGKTELPQQRRFICLLSVIIMYKPLKFLQLRAEPAKLNPQKWVSWCFIQIVSNQKALHASTALICHWECYIHSYPLAIHRLPPSARPWAMPRSSNYEKSRRWRSSWRHGMMRCLR
jgi:hypothetical protein